MALVSSQILAFRDATLSPAALSANLARAAREARDALIRSGEAPPVYTTIVDGRRDAAEETVGPDGTIRYLFNVLGLAVAHALTQAKALSPAGPSGDYRSAWMLAVNGTRYQGRIEDIPSDAEVTIVNSVPYARKLEVIAGKGRGGSRVIERVRQATMRAYPSIRAERTFVNLSAAFRFGRYETPYRLRGRRRGRRGLGEITYPAIILTVRP